MLRAARLLKRIQRFSKSSPVRSCLSRRPKQKPRSWSGANNSAITPEAAGDRDHRISRRDSPSIVCWIDRAALLTGSSRRSPICNSLLVTRCRGSRTAVIIKKKCIALALKGKARRISRLDAHTIERSQLYLPVLHCDTHQHVRSCTNGAG